MGGEQGKNGGFWSPRLEANRSLSIFHQWQQYELRGTVDNFRILAGLKDGVRRGFFYADSDLHKWADAAGRMLRSCPDGRLEALLGEYADLMARCQEADGYLFTWNQLVFPGTRWKNLLLEHELYCHGHFIEAGVSHFEATGRRGLLDCAERAAGLVVREFRDSGPERTSGHEEIEIALIRLYRITRKPEYLETARNLLERRGRMRFFGATFVLQLLSTLLRARKAGRGFDLGEHRKARESPFLILRALPLFLGGAWQQQDRPMRQRTEPRGHAVRWSYLMTAAAMLHRESPDSSLLEWLEASWERLVDEKMYVTGGIGSLPLIEGFGRPFELDNRSAYAETCAAIGCILWNRELSLATGRARYADLVEWQLGNAAAGGVSLSGDRWFYRNPLASDGELERLPWYDTACCPSNLSRLWAEVPGLAWSRQGGTLCIDQYIGGSYRFGDGVRARMESELPWEGRVRIRMVSESAITLRLRIPGWAGRAGVRVLGEAPRTIDRRAAAPGPGPRREATVFGAARFGRAEYLQLELKSGTTAIELDFDMDIALLQAHPSVRPDRGRVAVARGSLVWCAESLDNPGLDLGRLDLDPDSLGYAWDPSLFGSGSGTIVGRTVEGAPLRLVPYCRWGNRGAGAMRLWLRASGIQRPKAR